MNTEASTTGIRKGTIVTNIKTGKQYVATDEPYVGVNEKLSVYVRSISGKGAGHYMQAANLRVVE